MVLDMGKLVVENLASQQLTINIVDYFLNV